MSDQKSPDLDNDTKQMLADAERQEPSNSQSNNPLSDSKSQDAGAEDHTHPDSQPEIVTKTRNVGLNRKTLMTILLILVVVAGGVIAYLMQKNSKQPSSTTTSTVQEIQRFGVAVGLVEGKVEYADSESTDYKTLDANVDLTEGMKVRTGGDGRVVLLIDDGSAIRLSYSSEISLKSLDTSDVRVDNLSGEVYSRVVKSDSRRYAVYIDGDLYEAKGTAFRTISKETKKGVEVYQSSVEAMNKDTVVSEGSAYLTLSEQKDKENVISQIDLAALKSDEFIKWNADQDKKTAEFADKLGVLVDLDKVVEAPAPVAPKPKATAGIVLRGSQSEYSAVFSWTVTGIDVSKGFKLVGSKKTKAPTYPENSIAYIEAGKTSFTHFAGDGNTINYRLCAYRDGTCESYSNVVTVTTTAKPKPIVESGAVTLTITGTVASWTVIGDAPYGYKVLVGTTTAPTYEDNFKKLYTADKTIDLAGELDSGSYFIRVCKYTDGGCQDYSDPLSYLAP
jgi:FecR protein